jgi:hypothetical protein
MFLVFLSINMMADRLTTRPEIFGYFLFSILFWALDSSFPKRRPTLFFVFCSLLIVLWVNLHISFVFGLILIYLWTFLTLIKKGFSLPYGKENPYQKIVWIIPIISTVITLVNPAGPRGAVMPLSIMKDYGYTIVENMTPFFLRAFKPQPEYWIYAALMVMTFILAFLTGKLGKFAGLVLLVFSVFPLIAVRHLPFFGLIFPIVLTPMIAKWIKGLTFASAKVRPYGLYVTGGLLIAAFTNPIPLAYAKLPSVGLAADRRHQEAVKFVKKHDLQGRMWNNYDIGSFLEWALPRYPTFVDGRPEAFPAGFFRQTYIPMQESREKWDEIVRANDIQWIFAALTDATPWFQKWWTMIRKHEDWKLVYIDKSTAILVRRDGINQNIKPTKGSILEIYDY